MENCTSIPQLPDDCHSPLTTIAITPKMVFEKLMQLNPTKAPGPEGWPLFCLKECAQELSIPLSILFNKSLKFPVLPDHWKEALHLRREIALELITTALLVSPHPSAKLWNPLLRTTYQANNIIPPQQHGFTSGRSCSTQLLLDMNDWTNALDAGHSVDILYFDFAKAFDSVPHNRLISKLQSCGISGNLLEWVRNFLVGRKQKVVLNNYESEWLNVLSGAPQGSVLCPILFNIYVSDMPLIVNSSIVQFADDVKMFKTIASVNDYLQLQHDINLLYEWSKKWQLKFNFSKNVTCCTT